MASSSKPKCGSCGGGSNNTVVDAVPINTSQAPSACLPAPTTSCKCPSVNPSPCPEDHTDVKVIKRFAFTLKVNNSFNWPADGEDVELFTSNVESLLPGLLLWNPTVGYLYVQTFDYKQQKIVARNKGDSCNVKSAGDLIPNCTEFGVGPIPCSTGGGVQPTDTQPFLNSDLNAPAEGECAFVKVTTIAGLSIGDTVSIQSYKYRIDDIPDGETIKVCNDGEGAPAGTVIQSDPNCDGVPDVPIFVISANPCLRDPVNQGVLIVCDNNVDKPIHGTIDGQILEWDNVAQTWKLKIVNLPDTNCTSLTVCLTLDPDHEGSYLATVESTENFEAGEIVEIEGQLFVVDDIVDGTHMHVTPQFTVVEITDYEIGTAVCEADCCVDLQKQIDCINQGQRFAITPQLFNIPLALDLDGKDEVVVTNNLLGVAFTAPDDCEDALYQVRLNLNVAWLQSHDPGVIMQEVQSYWNTNPVGGRVASTDFGSDGFDITETYPPSDQAAIWSILQILAGGLFPMMYWAGAINSDTVLAAGASDTISLIYKTVQGQNNQPSIVNAAALYVTGYIDLVRIS